MLGSVGSTGGAAHSATASRHPGRRWRTAPSGGYLLVVTGLLLLSFNVTRVTSASPISDVFFAAALGVTWLSMAYGARQDIKPFHERHTSPLLLIGVLLLLTGGTLSSFLATNPVLSASRVARLGWILIPWFWLIRTLTPDLLRLQRLLRAFKISMTIAATIAVSDYLGITSFGNSPVMNREVAYFTHPNMLGGALAVVLPLIVMDVRTAKREQSRRSLILSGTNLVLSLAAVGATGSMTAMTATIAGIVATGVVLALTGNGRSSGSHGPRAARSSLSPVIVIVVFSLIGVWFTSSDLPVMNRFTALVSGNDQGVETSVTSRPAQNLFVIDRLDSLLLVGNGHDTESTSQAWTADNIAGHGAHNIFVKLLFEAGLMAVVGFGMILLVTLRQGWALVAHSRGTAFYPTMVALLGGFVAGNVTGQMNPVITERWYWLPPAFIGAVWAMRHRLREDASTSTAQPTMIEQDHNPRTSDQVERPATRELGLNEE